MRFDRFVEEYYLEAGYPRRLYGSDLMMRVMSILDELPRLASSMRLKKDGYYIRLSNATKMLRLWDEVEYHMETITLNPLTTNLYERFYKVSGDISHIFTTNPYVEED